MKTKLISIFNWLEGKKQDGNTNLQTNNINNLHIKLQQVRLLLTIIVVACLIVGIISIFISNKKALKSKPVAEAAVLTVELADKTLDPEKHWRNYFEEKQEQLLKEVDKRLADILAQQTDILRQTNQRIEEELAATKEKLAFAQRELSSASLDLQRAARNEQEAASNPGIVEAELATQEFGQQVEFDQPKSAKNYIPEGTYFTGHLLGGIAVSTSLNTPDDNATPVAIKLMARFDVADRLTTNLSPLNNLALQDCRIFGSAYGDLSSERAIVRLEKMVCEQDGIYITSKIAGQLFGSDGLNGIKGTVIATSSKHIKNAAIGGLISGISAVAKGREGSTITGAGLIQTPKKGAKSLLGEGALQGSSNAGDKIADYYLRQAEAMSPVLTVPSGVRVNAQITKGFFVGEISTHKKIKAARTDNARARSEIKQNIQAEYNQ